MKKTYVTPVAERIKFEYRDQVVATSSIGNCTSQWSNKEYTNTDCKYIEGSANRQ